MLSENALLVCFHFSKGNKRLNGKYKGKGRWTMKRAVMIVMDGTGVGELPDSHRYGDEGSDTLGNILRSLPDLRLPNLEKLGLGNIEGIKALPEAPKPMACFGRMAEASAGKDTTTGHWEIAGIIMDRPFPTYPGGFPEKIIAEFERLTGRKTLGNYPASGTEIIKRLGDEHVRTGYPIIYTSADSVFQIAAHEDVIPVESLYEMCLIARKLLREEHAVARVIARPFTGKSGSYRRTDARRDFSVDPPATTLLDLVSASGMEVKAVGKITDIFNGRGITESVKTHDNRDGVMKTLELIGQDFEGLIFTNLVDFDMKYGHRNDVHGFARALAEFDEVLPQIIDSLKPHDLLIITADHGCDPTTPSTDHSREYVPLLVYSKSAAGGRNLGTRKTFADAGATVAEYLGVGLLKAGTSFLDKLEIKL